MDIQDFIRFLTAARLDKKGAWFCWEGFVIVKGFCKKVLVKGCNLHFQRFEVNGYKCLGNYPTSVKQWKEEIIKALESAV